MIVHNDRPLKLEEMMEVRGILNSVEESPDGGIVAMFGSCPVWLPCELGPQLRALMGRLVGLLHLCGYRVRDLWAEERAQRERQ